MDDNTASFRLTPEQWQAIQPLFPPPPANTPRGRPPADNRSILEGILWKLLNASAWSDLPADYPSHQTCYRRYTQWRRDGMLAEIYLALEEDLWERGGIDFQDALGDGRIKFVSRRGSYRLVVDPAIRGTWQYESILLCLILLLDKLRDRPDLLTDHTK